MRIDLTSSGYSRKCHSCKCDIPARTIYAKMYESEGAFALDIKEYKVRCSKCVKVYYSKILYTLNEHIFIPLGLEGVVYQNIIMPYCPKCNSKEFVTDEMKFDSVFIHMEMTCLSCRIRYKVSWASYSKEIIQNQTNNEPNLFEGEKNESRL